MIIILISLLTGELYSVYKFKCIYIFFLKLYYFKIGFLFNYSDAIVNSCYIGGSLTINNQTAFSKPVISNCPLDIIYSYCSVY